ncbi:MFS general substrate transporter [Lichtheimia hyalospora FSU 10163]|nr:MFS general substrate transporter [Lichtheimia hyalospora FSU 10163]
MAGDNDLTTTACSMNEKATANLDDTINGVRKHLNRKLDIRLVVWAFLGHFGMQLDRNNLSNAYVSGMREDLNLESAAYNWAFTVNNIGITVIHPRWFFPSLPLLWGVVQCCMAFVTNHQGLLALRFCLGLTQSVFQPGIVYVLGTWYTQVEVSKRISIFRSALSVSSAVGGLIAGGIVQTIANRGGLRAWQWIFLVEGLISVAIGMAGYFMMPNYPHQTTSWINENERLITLNTQSSRDVTISSTPYNWKTQNVAGSPYVPILTVITILSTMFLKFTTSFVIILKDMGYDGAFANYMTTPLNLFAGIICIVIGWSSDWFNDRAIHLGVMSAWATIWNIALAAVNRGDNPAVLVFLAAYAIEVLLAAISLTFAWTLIIYRADPNARALAVSIVSSVGFLVPAFMQVKLWVVTDSPVFWIGKITNIAFGCVAMIAVLLVWFLLRIRFRIPQSTADKPDDSFRVEEEIKRVDPATA